MADLSKIDKLKSGRLFMLSDIFVFGAALALIGILLAVSLTRPQGATARVFVGNKFYAEYPLDKDSEHTLVSLDGKYSIVLLIKDGRAMVTDSTCPDHVCEIPKSGISRVNQSIVCLPAGIVIRIAGDSEIDSFV